jgi:hypothetical protein
MKKVYSLKFLVSVSLVKKAMMAGNHLTTQPFFNKQEIHPIARR